MVVQTARWILKDSLCMLELCGDVTVSGDSKNCPQKLRRQVMQVKCIHCLRKVFLVFYHFIFGLLQVDRSNTRICFCIEGKEMEYSSKTVRLFMRGESGREDPGRGRFKEKLCGRRRNLREVVEKILGVQNRQCSSEFNVCTCKLLEDLVKMWMLLQ